MDLKNIEIALNEIIATGHPRYAEMAENAMRSLREGGHIGPKKGNELSN